MKMTIAALIAAACLHAQTPAEPMTVARLYDSQLKSAEGEVVSLAEAMPENKFGFRPTAGEFSNVRTFAEQLKHIAAVNYLVAAAVLGEKVPVDIGKGESGPEDVKTKEAVVKFLKDSYVYAHKATLSLTAANQLDIIQTPFGSQKSARAGMANLTVWHSFDHYGQIVVYARMNGVVPPASR